MLISKSTFLTVVRNVALLGMVAALIVLGACSSCKEYEEQIMQLDAQIADLQSQVSEKEATNAECEQIAGELRDNLKLIKAENAVLIEQLDEVIYITIQDEVMFGSGQSMVLDTMVPSLKAVASALNQHPDWEIFVAGYTDNKKVMEEYQEKYPSNWELGAHRSGAVVRYLTNELGMSAERFAVMSYGPFRPVASNDTEEGRAQNRMVRMILHKPESM